ncbi:19201_t:CDS:2 [Rhizophagus irregularis]|nr:19201_t:CDS:2 [Rhizophagus irregularis]
MSRRDFNGTNGPIRFKESLRFDDKFSQLYQRKRKFAFYVMHRTNGGLHVVDVLTEFSIPSTKDQLFKKIVPFTKTHVGVSESPVDASPSKASRTHDALTNSELIFL